MEYIKHNIVKILPATATFVPPSPKAFPLNFFLHAQLCDSLINPVTVQFILCDRFKA